MSWPSRSQSVASQTRVALRSASRIAFSFAALLPRPRVVKAFGPQQDRRPAFPGRLDVLGFEQVQQMALGGEDPSVARADRGANVLRLAGLFRDDNLVGHWLAGTLCSGDRFDVR